MTVKPKPRWKPAAGKKWRDALDRPHANYGKLVSIPPMHRKPGGPRSLLIPSPRAVDARLRKVRNGSLLTLGRLRADLARGTAADLACPMTTGIFLRIVAEAAEESRREGAAHITPWWRIVRDDGSLFEKLPGGAAGHARRLKAEGHTVARGRVALPPRAGAARA